MFFYFVFLLAQSTIIIWYIYLSIIHCVWMHRCECVVISLSYKCQCILICTYTVNEVNLNLFLVWPRSLEWTVDGCKNGASKWTNYKNEKNLLYVVLVGKIFHLITNIYIRVQFLFSKRGACFYWVPCFYWDIYGIGNFNVKLNGRWIPQIVNRDSGNLYPIYIKQIVVLVF